MGFSGGVLRIRSTSVAMVYSQLCQGGFWVPDDATGTANKGSGDYIDGCAEISGKRSVSS